MIDKPLTMKEAAAYCGRTYESFRYWIIRSRGPMVTFFGKRKFFMKSDLDEWKPDDKRHHTKSGDK